MDVDPMGIVEGVNEDGDDPSSAEKEKRRSHLNNWVAIMVALLASFMGICKKQVEKETKEIADVQNQAKGFDADYDRLNYHDDQFDLSDALLAIAISLFAVTSLTQKRWLFALALAPSLFGVIFGVAGLF